MSFNAKTAPAATGVRAEPLDAGIYKARLVQLIDFGLQPREYQGKEKEPAQVISLTFELADEFLMDEDGEPDESKPRWLSMSFPLFNLTVDQAKSTQVYEALDPNMEADGDFSALIGKPANIHVVKSEGKNKKVYNNISGVAPVRKNELKYFPELVNEPVIFSLEDPDLEVFNKLPKWIQDVIKSNLEFNGSKLQGLLGEATPPASDEAEDSDENPY